MRRVVAFATTLLLLQAIFAPAVFACGLMGSRQMATPMGATASQQAPGSGDDCGMPMQAPPAGTHRGGSHGSCNGAPASMPCTSGPCAALSGCGIVAFLPVTGVPAFVAQVPNESPVLVQSGHTRAAAPEPPPPKA